MNTWSQQQEQQQEQELHKSSANRLYGCKPVKKLNIRTLYLSSTNSTLRVLIIVPRSFRSFLQWQSENLAALATYGRRLLH